MDGTQRLRNQRRTGRNWTWTRDTCVHRRENRAGSRAGIPASGSRRRYVWMAWEAHSLALNLQRGSCTLSPWPRKLFHQVRHAQPVHTPDEMLLDLTTFFLPHHRRRKEGTLIVAYRSSPSSHIQHTAYGLRTTLPRARLHG